MCRGKFVIGKFVELIFLGGKFMGQICWPYLSEEFVRKMCMENMWGKYVEEICWENFVRGYMGKAYWGKFVRSKFLELIFVGGMSHWCFTCQNSLRIMIAFTQPGDQFHLPSSMKFCKNSFYIFLKMNQFIFL